MPKSIGRKGIIAIVLALIAVIGVASLAFFTDRVDHSMQFTTASFSADGYKLTRTAPEGPFCAGEEVTATLKESNTGDDDVNSIISMKATWVSPDTSLSIFGNASAADNATLSIGGTKVDYTVSADNKSITFDLPKQVLAAGTKDTARDLTLTIPASFKSTGRIEFTFEKVVVAQEGGGFSKEYSRTDLNAAGDLDYSVKVGWAASSIEAQNGKALMGYLTDKNASGKFGIEFELAFNYTESPMKDFSSRTGAKWSYYKGAVDRLTFVEGMTTIGDYAFPDFSAVKSVSFPTTVKTIGLSAFDASGLTGTVTIPATVKEIKSLAFGNLPNVKTFTFGHTTDSLTLPDNTAAGKRSTGAFYVPTHVDTTVNASVEAIMYGYKWHDGYDNRRLVPTLNAQDTWFRTYTSGSDYTAKLDEDVLETVTFADYHMPVTGETSWDASDPSVPGTVTAFLSADKKSLILAGNGYGLIFANEDSSGAFGKLTALETVSNTDLLDTRNATTMAYMFNFDQKLANISVTTWNVSKVESMSNMFYCCDSLPSIDLRPNTCTAKDGSGQYTAWNTASLKNTGGMFQDCSALTSLDVSGWDTSNVTDMGYMFYNCEALTSLDLSGWDTSKVTDMRSMFSSCYALTSLDLSGWNTSNVTDMSYMFYDCSALTSLDLSGFDTTKVTNMDYMFKGCNKLQAITLGANFWFSNEYSALPAPNSDYIEGADGRWYDNEVCFFGYTPKLLTYANRLQTITYLAVDPAPMLAPRQTWNKSTGTVNGVTFSIDYTPTGNEDESWDASAAGDGGVMAYRTGTTVTLTPTNGTKRILANPDSQGAFKGIKCNAGAHWVQESLELIGINSPDSLPHLIRPVEYANAGYDTSKPNSYNEPRAILDTHRAEDMSYMFADGGNPAENNTMLCLFDTSSATTMASMFSNNSNLQTIVISSPTSITIANEYGGAHANFDLSNVTNMSYMFANCRYLEEVKMNPTDLSNVENVFGMFSYTKISYFSLASDVTPKSMAGMFMNCMNLEAVDFLGVHDFTLDTSNTTDMSYMFANCRTLASVDLSSWDTSNVTNMIYMFNNCFALTSLDLSGFDTANVTAMSNMFASCSALTKIYVSDLWSTASVTSSTRMFYGCSKLSGAISYNSSKTDATYANYTTGYLTKKAAPARSMSIMSNGNEISGYSISE